MLNNLTTLANVKSWVGSSTTNDDALLTRLIAASSRFILSHLQRPSLFLRSYSDVFDGVGGASQMLRHWPVQSVDSVSVDSLTIAAAVSATGSGYVLDSWDGYPPGCPQAVNLRGYRFSQGLGNVSVTYRAGFAVLNEAQMVPSSGQFTVTVQAPNGNWGADGGVTYAGSGIALVPVASNPTAGQYAVAAGVYTFAAEDAGAAVLLSYSYIPADIEQACIEMVGERYSYKARIGQTSKSLGGQETVSFDLKDMPAYVRTLLQPYRRSLPI